MNAATFAVPDDRTFLRQADAIVVASALESHVGTTAHETIETVTTFSLEEVIKGALLADTFEVAEPGGKYRERVTAIPGVPRFHDGERALLFLVHAGGKWRVLDIALGRFAFATDVSGRKLLVRDEGEIAGWDGNGKVHLEPRRAEKEFLDFLRVESKGGNGDENYFVPKERLVPNRAFAADLDNAVSAAYRGTISTVFTANSYAFATDGTNNGTGARWTVFPGAISFKYVGTEPGAPGNGVTAVDAAVSAWDGDSNSNVLYVDAGQDTSGTHTGGVSTPDCQNTIAFERDLSAFGIPAFSCNAHGYSGTLGVGGFSSAGNDPTHCGYSNAGTATFSGSSFYIANEGDVEMNQGIANCTLLFSNGDFNSAVTHEVGHTLGFRHSDQTRADDPTVACATDSSLECATTAIMKSFIPNGLNGALQTYDQHAVAALYPLTGSGPAAPTSFTATEASATSVSLAWTASTGSPAFYNIYRSSPTSYTTFTKIATSTATNYTDSTVAATNAYLYKITGVNGNGESSASNVDVATTVVFTDDPLSSSTAIKLTHLTDLRTAVNAVRTLAVLGGYSYTDPNPTTSTPVKAVHVTDLRTALDAAMSTMGLTTGGYTNTLTGGTSAIKAIDFQEIRNRVK